MKNEEKNEQTEMATERMLWLLVLVFVVGVFVAKGIITFWGYVEYLIYR